MKNNVLIVPGIESESVRLGYVDAFEALGYKVYVYEPKHKLSFIDIVNRYSIGFVMISSGSLSILDIDTINKNNISVFVDILPLNDNRKTLYGARDLADDCEPSIVRQIDSCVCHTHVAKHLWSEYFNGWINSQIQPLYVPLAGNIIRAQPRTCSIMTDFVLVSDFSRKKTVVNKLLKQLLDRFDILGYECQIFGDNTLDDLGLFNNGFINPSDQRLPSVYASSKVSINVHEEEETSNCICVNDMSFFIPLCGGLQLSDNPMIADHLGPNVVYGRSIKEFIDKALDMVQNQQNRSDKILEASDFVARNHTYFNRIAVLFGSIGLQQESEGIELFGDRSATKHCWSLQTLMEAEERGVLYEKEFIGS